jgi:3-hydroxyisobutyrate dehydrogenase-like beta-hydroxyacid dehydrogenase
MRVLRGSALYAATFDKKLKRMIDGDYSHPNFPTKHLAKDIGLFLEEAKSLSLETGALEGVLRVVEMALGRGWSEGDYTALFDVIQLERDES